MTMYNDNFLQYFTGHFNQTYEELYDGRYTDILGEKQWHQALEHFDHGLSREEHHLLTDFVNYRNDFVSSDREAVAFILALNCIDDYRDPEYDAWLKKRHRKH